MQQMNAEDLKYHEEHIKNLIDEILSQLPYLDQEAKGDPYSCSIGKVSWMDAQNDKGVNSRILEQSRQRIERLQNALRRIESGNYGMCVRCGEEIPRGRLEIVPEALICIPCSEKKPRR